MLGKAASRVEHELHEAGVGFVVKRRVDVTPVIIERDCVEQAVAVDVHPRVEPGAAEVQSPWARRDGVDGAGAGGDDAPWRAASNRRVQLVLHVTEERGGAGT